MRKNNIAAKSIMIIIMAIVLVIGNNNNNNNIKISSQEKSSNHNMIYEEELEIKANALIEPLDEKLEIKPSAKITEKEEPVIVYDDLTMEQLVAKLNRVMYSSLTGKGEIFASRAIEMGVDPYIALAIVLQETGCYWGSCSAMVQQCNNIGGMKGGYNGCWGSDYAVFGTIDEGIISFIDNLAYGYFYQGLNTPELMNRKYAEDQTWAAKVNNYVNIIKNS